MSVYETLDTLNGHAGTNADGGRLTGKSGTGVLVVFGAFLRGVGLVSTDLLGYVCVRRRMVGGAMVV